MSYECIYCNFSAPTTSRLNRHLSTQKHVRNEFLYKEEKEKENVQEDAQQILNELVENIEETIKPEVLDKEENEVEINIKLCENTDCERHPPDWDFEEDTEETYQEDQWKKCCLCDGYFDDNGMGDILFVQEEPNNQEAGCSLCGKSDDVVQMKGCGQYLCGNACDESENEEESVQEEDNIPDETQQIIDNLIEDVQDFLKKQENEDVQDLENEILDNNDRDPCPNSIMSPWITHDDGCSLCGKQETEQSICENACDEEEIVQRSDKNDDFDEFFNPLILDIQTIEMIKNINEILTTHPFILQTVNIFMNIVKWFSFPTAPFDVKLIQDDHKG